MPIFRADPAYPANSLSIELVRPLPTRGIIAGVSSVVCFVTLFCFFTVYSPRVSAPALLAESLPLKPVFEAQVSAAQLSLDADASLEFKTPKSSVVVPAKLIRASTNSESILLQPTSDIDPVLLHPGTQIYARVSARPRSLLELALQPLMDPKPKGAAPKDP